MAGAFSAGTLARVSARRPWVTVGLWFVMLVAAGVAAFLWLGDSLTSANRFSVKPESIVADELRSERFSSAGPQEVTEIVYIHSAELTVDDPAFREFATELYGAVMALGTDVVPLGVSYYLAPVDRLVSLDRHSTGLVFTFEDDFPERANRAALFAAIEAVAVDPRFEVFRLRAPGSNRPEMMIVESEVHRVDSPEFRQFVEDLLLEIARLGRAAVGGAITYYAAADPSLVSADGTATLIPVILNNWDYTEQLIEIVREARAHPDFDVAMTGLATTDHDFQETSERDLTQGELMFGLPAAIVVLVLVFGAIVAALVPLLSAIVSIGIALGLAGLVGTTTDLSLFIVNMVFMMGLAVGIDYGLFIIARYREERAHGHDVYASVVRAGATAGQAVLFSGVTVVLALAGLLFVPVNIFFSLGIGAILVVIVSIIASLTLVPAVLRLLGDRIDRLRIPFIKGPGAEVREGGVWASIANVVMRAPAVFLVASVAILLALASPTLDLKTGAAGVSSFPDSAEAKRGFVLLQEKFQTGVVTPTHVIIDGIAADPAVRTAVDELKADIAADGAFGTVTEQVNAAGNTVWLQMPVVSGDAVSQAATQAVQRLRSDYIPAAFEGVPARALVTGETAGNLDWFKVADAAPPIVLPFVLGLSFILLLVIFRSIVIPVAAIVMNLLSVGAAYGLLVLVFQKGVGNELFGFTQVATVEAWIPVFLFSVLFGLSMDYHVFLLSRIREHFVATGDNTGSIAFGVRSTGRLITGAALIMVAVFAGFASGDLVMFQQVGFGLGVAVLLDATIVRSVLVPAVMRLLGRWNWYLPRFLNWLPRISIDGPEPEKKPAATQ